MSRLSRKDEHIFSALKLGSRQKASGFDDVTIVHNALPEVSVNEVSLGTEIFGKTLKAPFIINAITGGGSLPGRLNEALATAARETGVGMAVGSQTVALENPQYERSFKVVRKINPDGLVLANIGANVPIDKVRRGVDMIRADALQIHLNAPQELTMREGDTDFKGWTKHISRLVQAIEVPVIIKEVGFGLSSEVVTDLAHLGIRHFDIGGRGGTNFIAIENLRGRRNLSYLESWGITTVSSLIETENTGLTKTIIATGGITSALDVVKALILGAKVAGLAGSFLKTLFSSGVPGLINSIEKLKCDLLRIMMMTGVTSTCRLKRVPVVITGKTREWLTERGIDTRKYAQRSYLGRLM